MLNMRNDMEKNANRYVHDTDAESDSSYDFTDKPPSYTSRPELPIREKPAVPAGKPRMVPRHDATYGGAAASQAEYKDVIARSPPQDILPALMNTELGVRGDPWYRRPDGRYYTNDQNIRGWFSHSSKSIMLVVLPDSGLNLVAECSTVSGTRKVSMIALDDIISNWDGHFKWVGRGQQGKFSLSARGVRLEDGGRLLVAELGKVDGSWRKDTLKLDEMISNDNGNLVAIHHNRPVYAHDAI